MTLREKIEVMEAFERGEEIEYTPLMEEIWRGTTIPAWDWALYEYRIKPKKQVVIIEKWLCRRSGDDTCMYIREATKEDFGYSIIQVKLLDTYEVTL